MRQLPRLLLSFLFASSASVMFAQATDTPTDTPTNTPSNTPTNTPTP